MNFQSSEKLNNNSYRVVVTGMGAVTPLGTDLPATWQRLLRGEAADQAVTLFDVSGCRCKIAAEAFLPTLSVLSPKKLSRLSRASRLALPAAREALDQAGLLVPNLKSLSRHGGDQISNLKFGTLPLSVSTTGGAMAFGEHFVRARLAGGKSKDQFFHSARYQPHHQIRDLHEFFGFQGPATIIANACASGANAVGHASDLIRAGHCECVLTGGYEALAELIYVGFDSLQALTRDQCRPFDRNRSGLMLGEGAAFLVLESEEYARERGAEILCELAGYGHRTDLHHLTQPDPAGPALISAMRMALDRARLLPANIGYLNAHGTGTLLNDGSECAAMNAVFGDQSPSVRVSSTKAAIGHTLGAAGSIEAIFAIQALLTGDLPPQINTREPDPLLHQKLAAVGEKYSDLKAVMSANLGFGGSNAALIFKRYESL